MQVITSPGLDVDPHSALEKHARIHSAGAPTKVSSSLKRASCLTPRRKTIVYATGIADGRRVHNRKRGQKSKFAPCALTFSSVPSPSVPWPCPSSSPLSTSSSLPCTYMKLADQERMDQVIPISCDEARVDSRRAPTEWATPKPERKCVFVTSRGREAVAAIGVSAR